MYRKYYEYIPNFTVVGSPAIFENSVTGFSSSNYLKTIPESIPFETADNWEVVFKFKYTSSSNEQTFLAQPVSYESIFKINPEKTLGLLINTTGNSTYACTLNGNDVFTEGQIYYAKAGFTGTEYYIEYSTDGEIWLDRVFYETTTKLTNRDIWTLGVHMQSGYYKEFNGIIYLDGSYIKINGNYYWKGVTYQEYVEKTIPNIFTIGSPTNNDCILSNFSNSNYLQLLEGFAPGNNIWEMVWKVKTPSSISDTPITGNYDNTYQNAVEIGIDGGKWRLVLPKDGTSTYLANISGTHSVQVNTIYWLKAEFTGSQYILSYSLDGLMYTQDAIIDSSEIVYQAPKSFYIGNNAWKASSGTYWTGSIDLNECYIKINGQYWWKGTVTPSWDFYKDFYNYKAKKELVRHYYKYIAWTQPVMSVNTQNGVSLSATNFNSNNLYILMNGVSDSDSDYICPTSTSSYGSTFIINLDYSIKLTQFVFNYYAKTNVTYGIGSLKVIAIANGIEVDITPQNLPDGGGWYTVSSQVDNITTNCIKVYCSTTGNPYVRFGEITLQGDKIVESTEQDYDFYKDAYEYKLLVEDTAIGYTSLTFESSSRIQEWTVPEGITKVRVDCVASKGNDGSNAGGKGGRVQCDLTVTPGQTYYIVVGDIPETSSTASYNASDIRTSNIDGVTGSTSLASRVIVAGGGGSSGAGTASNIQGGDGGGLIGQAGPNGWSGGGQGGTQSAGGAHGVHVSGDLRGSNHGTDGEFGMGGTGTAGGGAGWYGGGAGFAGDYRSVGTQCAGGGGGSSYTDSNLCTEISGVDLHTQGYNNDKGYITISAVNGTDYIYYKHIKYCKAIKC